MLNANDSSAVVSHICYTTTAVGEELKYQMCRPSTIHKPRIFIDGDQWCALYGEGLQSGVAGFGSSPEKAMVAFDVAWGENLPVSAARKATSADVFGDMLQGNRHEHL